MSTLVTIVHVAVCLFLMLTVLLQSGKGGGMGAAFGGGGSQTVFGGSGAGNFLRRLTVICAALFMITSMALAFMASSTGSDSLRRYAEQQKQLRESMEQTRQEALQGAEGAATPEQPATPDQGTAEEGAAVEGGDMVAPEGTEGADVAPAGEAPATGEAAPAGDTAAPGAAPAPAPSAAPGATQDQPGAAAGQTAPVAPAPPAGAAAQGGQGATPNP